MFKISSDLLFDEPLIQNAIRESNSKIVTVHRDFFVLAKTAQRKEIEAMHDLLAPYGIMQFVRSGRIAVSKEAMPISEMLAEFHINNK